MTKTALQTAPEVFDRALLRLRRDRAAANFAEFDFLFEAVGDQLADRLADVKREFPVIADLGAGTSTLTRSLRQRPGTQHVIALDMSQGMAASVWGAAKGQVVVADEDLLPFAPHSLDAVIANLSLHWVNDLPGALAQIRQCLKPDGLFLAALMGGESLRELRESLMSAEMDVRGGASPRVSPLIDMQDMSALMQRAGFALPVVDRDTISVDYASPFRLMHDLRGMGAANATAARDKSPVTRAMMMETARIYAENHPAEDGEEEGGVAATFEIIYAIGWAPDASQQQPLKPGTAKLRLADALGGEEKEI